MVFPLTVPTLYRRDLNLPEHNRPHLQPTPITGLRSHWISVVARFFLFVCLTTWHKLEFSGKKNLDWENVSFRVFASAPALTPLSDGLWWTVMWNCRLTLTVSSPHCFWSWCFPIEIETLTKTISEQFYSGITHMTYRSRVQHGDLTIVTNLWSHKHSHFRTFLSLQKKFCVP